MDQYFLGITLSHIRSFLENPLVEKKNFGIIYHRKKLVWGSWRPNWFLPYWGTTPRKNDGDSAENQSVYRSGSFLKIKLMQWGVSWVTPPGSPNKSFLGMHLEISTYVEDTNKTLEQDSVDSCEEIDNWEYTEITLREIQNNYQIILKAVVFEQSKFLTISTCEPFSQIEDFWVFLVG